MKHFTLKNAAHSRLPVKISTTSQAMIYNQTGLVFISYLSSDEMNKKWPTGTVPSDMNLSAYLHFVNNMKAEKQHRLGKLKMMQHHPIGEPVRWRGKDGSMITIESYACADPVCVRCESESGGYRFQWLGPWTCEEIMNTNSPQLARYTWMRCTTCPACTLIKI